MNSVIVNMINRVVNNPGVNLWSIGHQFSYASTMAAHKMCTSPNIECWKSNIFVSKNLKERIENQEQILSKLGNPESLAMFLSRAKKKIKIVDDLELGDESKLGWIKPDSLVDAYINAVWAVDCVDTWITAYENTVDIKVSSR